MPGITSSIGQMVTVGCGQEHYGDAYFMYLYSLFANLAACRVSSRLSCHAILIPVCRY